MNGYRYCFSLSSSLLLLPEKPNQELIMRQIKECLGCGTNFLTFKNADIQKRENENKQLGLSGKAGEVITSQVNNLQDERNKVVQEAEDLIKELQKYKAKLNDP